MSSELQERPTWIAPWIVADDTATPDWIWVKGADGSLPTTTNTTAQRAFVAREIELGSAASGKIWIAADNSAQLYLDGERIGESKSWSSPDVFAIKLSAGSHVFRIHATNGVGNAENPAGILAFIDITTDTGEHFQIGTDENWIGGASDWDGSLQNAPRDVVALGPCTTAPWGTSPSVFRDSKPCPLLRRSFILEKLPVNAKVRVIGLGHYELTLNGQDVSPTVIDQGWSQYDKRLYWQEFDLLPFLKEGENVFGAQLGNSFWRVDATNQPDRFSKTDAMPDFSDGKPFLFWMDATFVQDDGSEVSIQSDEQWKWHDSPLTFSHIYGGEDWDARLEQQGWDEPDFDDSAWSGVMAVDAPPAQLAKLPFPGLKEFERFRPVRYSEPEPDVVTFTFPQNCSSLLEFTVEGKAGDTIRLLPSEYLDLETDRVKFTYTWGTGKDIYHEYTLKGGGEETHKIKFCYEGAQYVEVRGAVFSDSPNPDNLPVIKSIEMVVVRADNAIVGDFLCSNDIQNGAFRLIDWSIRSNMSYVPTDCPHREKNGWQEENWHMARAISYRFDIHDWYRKVAQDLRDTQYEDGFIPTNVPQYLVGLPPHSMFNDAPEWGVSSVLVPWHLYEWYGDKDVLKQSFESMKRYVDYLTSVSEDGLIDSNLGDWYDYGHGKGDGPSQWTPTKVSATAIWALGAKTVSTAAEALGQPEDADKYWSLFEQIRSDFQRHFWNAETKQVKNNGSPQAGNCTALVIDLIPEDDRDAALGEVIKDLEARGWQQTTGEVLQVFLVRALGGAGRNDILHKVYAREERGGYGFMVKQGFTTLPESWDAKPGTGNSMNHFMLGHLMEWHFAYVAGIRQLPGSVGWKQILIEPFPGPLESAQASFDSPNGEIAVEWTSKDGKFKMTVTVPDGAQAVVALPDGTVSEQDPGIQEYECTYIAPAM